MNYLPLFLLLLSMSVSAFVPSQSKEEFCADRKDKSFVKTLSQHSGNLMSFRNHGGLVNGGVCWWHSRFQRNALYLTYFNPHAPKPDRKTAITLIRDIRNQDGITEIPGFNNFEEFSIAFENEIQEELERWQKFESIRFTWIRGLRGASSVSPEWMKKLMDYLYEEVVTNKNIAFQKLQMKGVTAHAWLVVNMAKTPEGYDLDVIDSNFPDRTSFYQYREGDSHLVYPYMGQFVPYLENVNEMNWINETIQEECSSKVSKL
jgi:hypothetical protein